MVFNVFESTGYDYTPLTDINQNVINQWTTWYKYNCKNRDKIDIKITIESEEAWFLSGDRELYKLEKEVVSPPFPVGCFLVLKYEESYYQIDLPKYPYMKFTRENNKINIFFPLKDLSSIGLQFWGEKKIKKASEMIYFEVQIFKIDSLEECHWIEPYPNGAKSAICLTDHADWDSVEKIKQLADLFEKYDFKFTKSIFPHSDPQGKKQEPGLDNLEFKYQVDRLYAMGTEIAYHGFSPRITPPSFEACEDRMQMMDNFNPVTWIDHGTGEYLYSREAKCENGTSLVTLLDRQKIVNYWSYMDIWENAVSDLNVWNNRNIYSGIKDIFYLTVVKKYMNIKQFAYISVSLLKNLFGGAYYRQLKYFWKPLVFQKLKHQYRALKYLHKAPTVLYDEYGEFALMSKRKYWIFDTILLNHLALQLSPSAIDKLVESNGLLIAHCYMGAQHKYGGSNCFNDDLKNPKILKEFKTNIAYISLLQQEGKIVSLTFEELRESFEKFVRTKLVRERDTWKINYSLEENHE